jgi:hypothetical protein
MGATVKSSSELKAGIVQADQRGEVGDAVDKG